MFYISGLFVVASPDEIICVGNETIENVCEFNCTNYDFKFKYNWTDETISTKYNLICDRKSIQNDINTVGLAGLAVRRCSVQIGF